MALIIGNFVTFITMIDFKKIALVPVLAATFIMGGTITALATTASAANQDGTGPVQSMQRTNGRGSVDGMGPMRGNRPGVIGTVTAVQGSTITVTNADGAVRTIDASEAIIEKHVTSSLSDIAVGARINAMGDTSGTSVKAKVIVTGAPLFPLRQVQK